MNYIQLFINGKSAVLDEDCSLSIDMTSGVFNDSGTYSYPFSIPYKENRHILGLLDNPEDEVNLKGLEIPFELYLNGVMMLSGIARSDADSVSDTIDLELGSGNKVLLDKLDEINLRELTPVSPNDYGTVWVTPDGGGRPIEKESSWSTNYDRDYSMGNATCSAQVITSGVTTVYEWVTEGRPGSVPRPTDKVIYQGGFRTVAKLCPFVNYILDCIRSYADLQIRRNDMTAMPVFNTLAVLNTKYLFDKVPAAEAGKFKYLVSSKNFPDITASAFIEALSDGFGLRFISDEKDGALTMAFMRNVLNNVDASGTALPVIPLRAQIGSVTRIHPDPVYLRYTYGGDDDDTAFNCPLSDTVVYVDTFGDLPAIDRTDDSEPTGDNVYIRPERSATSRSSSPETRDVVAPGTNDYTRFSRSDMKKTDRLAVSDTNTYIVRNTGTRYRVKVDENGDNPYYFEVDQFRDYQAEGYNEEFGKEVEIKFKPVVNNLCGTGLAENSDDVHTSDRPVFVDCEGTIQAVRQHDAGFQLGFLQLDEKKMAHDDTVADYTPAFTADTMDLWGEAYDPVFADNFSLRIDADNSSEHIGIDPALLEGGVAQTTEQPRRGLIDNFHREYIEFMRRRRKVAITATLPLAELVNIDWTRRYRIGEYTGLLDKISFEVSNGGMSEVKLEMYLI